MAVRSNTERIGRVINSYPYFEVRSGNIDLPPISPEVTHVSSSQEIALAKQLKAIGAKMYGAFWCSHCFEQKQVTQSERRLTRV